MISHLLTWLIQKKTFESLFVKKNNPSIAATKVYEISDISYPHMADPEEDIQISVCEEKTSSYSLQKFSSNSLNFVHSLPMIVSETVEEFDFYIYEDAAGVHISNIGDILEIISDYKSDPFTLINLDLQ